MAKKNNTASTKKPKTKTVDGTGQSGTPELRRKIRAMGTDAYHIGHDQQTNQSVMQNLVQVRLDYYAMRGWIMPRQFDAGAEFHRLWYYGGIKSRFAQMRMDAAVGGVPMAEFNEACRKKYEEAKKSFRSLSHALVCFNVCCIGEWARYVTPVRAVMDGHGGDDDRGILRAAQSQRMEWLRDG